MLRGLILATNQEQNFDLTHQWSDLTLLLKIGFRLFETNALYTNSMNRLQKTYFCGYQCSEIFHIEQILIYL
jgi:hypothetical protein